MTLFDQPISFTDTPVRSVSGSQEDILLGIMKLYTPDGFDLDPCFNKGTFYAKSIPLPKFRSDINPIKENVQKADVRKLPHPDGIMSSVIFDPPFVVGTHKKSDPYTMAVKYSSFPTMADLIKFYSDATDELLRVTRNGGYIVIKCQDVVSGRRKYFAADIFNEIISGRAKKIDQLILIAKNRFIGKIIKQQHSRSYHCYFLVYRKNLK